MDAHDSQGGSGPRRRRRLSRRHRTWLLVLVPIAVSILSQFSFIQNSTCVLAELPWELGKCEVMADLIAPAWALAIIPVASRLREAAARHGTPSATLGSRLSRYSVARSWAEHSATAAQWGAIAIVALSYTREWERFGQQPEAEWFALVIIATFALLLVPVWWIRNDLHRRGVRYLDEGRMPRRVDRFLFDESGGRPARWPHILAFSAVTLIVAFTVLGQLDALLRGMHLPGDPAMGISGLPGLQEFDLSKKLDTVVERVRSWQVYTEAVGNTFGSPRTVVTAHAIFDTVATIPAYFTGGLTLAFYAWRKRRAFSMGSEIRRAFELVTLTGLFVLVATAVLDVGKNLLTWYVMDRAWTDPALLADANVRMLWFFTLARTIGLLVLAGSCLLLLALADTATRRLRQALVATRLEILVIVGFGTIILFLPQTADVIRGWRVSHTMITVGLAVIWSMLIRWTSVQNLRLQNRHRIQVEADDPPRPPTIRLPILGTSPTLGRFAGGLTVLLALAQLALVAMGVDAGSGLLIPAALVLVFWVFGLALPASPYVRGDRPVDVQLRRRIPRTLGSAVYLIIGLAAIKAASTSVPYARNEDWWLFIALVPPAIGIWRILTRTTNVMGALEAAFAGVVLVLAATLILGGDPELSPAALAFAGLTFAYGSLAYFNSYERSSLVNRISERFIRPGWAKPFVGVAGLALVAVVAWFYATPVAVAPVIGTIGMVVMAMMVLTVLGAGAIRLAELTRPPRILAAFGIKRTPVVALLVVWLLLAPAVADQTVTDVRVLASESPIPRGLDFDDVWGRWYDANVVAQEAPASPSGEGRRVIPMLLVSSSGGGLRAAVWTSFVLDCVFEAQADATGPCALPRDDDPLHRVAVMSSVSGGSLGVASYFAHDLDRVEGPRGGDSWVDEMLGDDYLAAPVGWLFFFDMPRALIGFGPDVSNRADLAERAWEASWPKTGPGLGRGIGEIWSDSGLPPVVFNGASVNDGCRINVSVLDVAGGSPEVPSCSGISPTETTTGSFGATHDVVDFLCPSDDLALSTVAGMSARFPIVSLAGRIAADPDRDCGERAAGAVFVADAGYLEGSGAGSLLDSWSALSTRVEQYNVSEADTCIVPFMLHIDNGYESPAVTANDAVPREFLVPLLATLNSSSGITTARADAALAFEHGFSIGGVDTEIVQLTQTGTRTIQSRYARLVTRAHPGVQAPLGWTLSQASIDDLRDQLAIIENATALTEIRTWIDEDLACVSSPEA